MQVSTTGANDRSPLVTKAANASMSEPENTLAARVGRQVSLSGQFDAPVVLEDARPLGANGSSGFECRVRLADGTLEETVISPEEVAAILDTEGDQTNKASRPVDADRLRLLVESTRIRHAYTYDRQFAVSLSGIRTLPHQIEAVYLKMLPQPRLRFLLADDPGAGKTIMAGLLIKELKLREALDRCLILTPAPLTIQWQDELLRFFNESFQIVHSANDQQQLLNLWERETQIISSIDYAKQDEVRERVWQQRWDLIIIDEASLTPTSAARTRNARRSAKTESSARNGTSLPSAFPNSATACCSSRPPRITAMTTVSRISSGCSIAICSPNRTVSVRRPAESAATS